MGQSGHGQIGRKLKGSGFNSEDKIYFKGIQINIGLIEYVPQTIVKK